MFESTRCECPGFTPDSHSLLEALEEPCPPYLLVLDAPDEFRNEITTSIAPISMVITVVTKLYTTLGLKREGTEDSSS